MRRSVVRAMHDTDFVIWARNIVQDSGANTRNQSEVARNIVAYIARAIVYAPDPAGFEHLMPPQEHMKCLKQRPSVLGDCDDASSLSAAIAGAVGISSAIEARAFWSAQAPYQHVVTVLLPRDGKPIECDTTHDAQKLPLKVFRRLSVRVP
jgi:hypothetical protein